MAQPNAKQDQPSMDDILASIRRIIDDGQAKKSAPVSALNGASVANDDVAAPPVDAAPIKPNPQPAEVKSAKSPLAEERSGEIGIPELDSFLESLDAKHAQEAASSDNEINDAIAAEHNVVTLEAAAEPIEQRQPLQTSKYEARFTDTDRSAFAQVGNVLSAQTAEADISPPDDANTVLISSNASKAVSLSFEDLSAVLMKEAGKDLPQLTEQMLKPMLSEWLDNNLPSMVERLVRSEIERIARGD